MTGFSIILLRKSSYTLKLDLCSLSKPVFDFAIIFSVRDILLVLIEFSSWNDILKTEI